MSLKKILIKYTLALFTGFLMTIILTIGFIFKRSEFQVKKRNAPKFLTDTSLWKHGYLTLKNIRIHYVEKGDPKKPLMLFLHGYPEFWYSWRHQLQEFSKDYWTVAIDMRGYGDSEKPPGMDSYAMDLLIDDVKHVVQALGRQKFILVGHDWGGIVSWNFVSKYHEMLLCYVILNAPHPPTFMQLVLSNKKQFFMSWYLFFYTLPYLPELTLPAFDFIAFEKVFRRNKPKELSRVTDEDIEAFKYTFGKPNALTPPVNYYRQFMKTWSTTESSKDIIDITPNGLLIFGELDDYLTREILNLAQKNVKNLQVNIVKGANHFVQQDDPDTVNKHITEFLRSNLVTTNADINASS
ncbi:epoxide hydrolase 1-like [Zootermopsis nevadensis]|uniref:Epoxide hydrolase 4 n=1 Tax=Zootermopsis nevadensis TaxID=136037 RepID=A0A067RWQ5_ZOONE|nr:epoxide hydrolase 1-like [Zootermopsis nevadensis]KDR24344.1 Epoxide hydrolase 4 [Zootermopsis nevadensis]